jgi:hypothetical protein
MSEWVGIDGGTGTDAYVIQAGIGESMTNPGTGACAQSGNQFSIWGWWELYPGPSIAIGAMTFDVGDQVTVDISRDGGYNWQVRLTDGTQGEADSFSTSGSTQQEPYDGPGDTAEWIVEAPEYAAVCGTGFTNGVCELAPYSPAVSFTGTALTGPVTGLLELAMYQGTDVSQPSAVSTWPSAFTVSDPAVASNAPDRRLLIPSTVPVRTLISPIYQGGSGSG